MSAGTPDTGTATPVTPCAQRLRRSSDVRSVFAARRVVSSNLMVMHARRRDDDGPARAAVVAGKGVGNAVRRNRAKRRLRGALTGCTAARGLDVVVIARPGVHDVPFAQLRGDLQALLDAAGRRP